MRKTSNFGLWFAHTHTETDRQRKTETERDTERDTHTEKIVTKKGYLVCSYTACFLPVFHVSLLALPASTMF